MIDFKRISSENAAQVKAHLLQSGVESCEYSLMNLSIWGHQKVAFVDGFLTVFSQFDRKSIYPFPLGTGDIKQVLDKLIRDARERGLLFRLTSLTAESRALLETLYPGQFRYHSDRDSFDYVYRIEDLAELRGKRYQSKRNFSNRFWGNHPDCQVLPLDESMEPAVRELLDSWFAQRSKIDPQADFQMEKRALERAFSHRECLQWEGIVLAEQGKVLAMTMGSRLSETTFDIHFEKALDGYDGAYAAINQAFATHLRNKYPELQFLNREDDMGIPGLRQAKLSYHPDHLVEKCWAKLLEDENAN